MAYNVSDEDLLKLCISDPSYCLFYHRDRVKQLLPSLAEAYLLVGNIQKELTKSLKES